MSVLQEAKLLSSIPIFSRLDIKKLQLLVLSSERLVYRKDQFLCRQGDSGNEAFIVISGEADILVDTGDGPLKVATIGEHGIVGEMAILCDQPRSASVKTVTPTLETLKIEKREFLAFLRDNPEVALEVTRHLAERLMKTTQDLARVRELAS
ncbi:MAG: cyclic nucleotide-binding domain-containing protein [Pseudomonadota bacterium]